MDGTHETMKGPNKDMNGTNEAMEGIISLTLPKTMNRSAVFSFSEQNNCCRYEGRWLAIEFLKSLRWIFLMPPVMEGTIGYERSESMNNGVKEQFVNSL